MRKSDRNITQGVLAGGILLSDFRIIITYRIQWSIGRDLFIFAFCGIIIYYLCEKYNDSA